MCEMKKDGFPRNCVIELILPDTVIIEKTLNRWLCSNSDCGACFNLSEINDESLNIFMPPLKPQKDGICDHVCCKSKQLFFFHFLSFHFICLSFKQGFCLLAFLQNLGHPQSNWISKTC